MWLQIGMDSMLKLLREFIIQTGFAVYCTGRIFLSGIITKEKHLLEIRLQREAMPRTREVYRVLVSHKDS
jgi:hypothetical protein